MKQRFFPWLVLVILLLSLPTGAEAAMTADDVPPQLAPWQSWVLHGQQEALCPSRYNDGAAVECLWPARLDLELSASGGTFEQTWQVFAQGWAALPGGTEAWPEGVLLDGQPAVVVPRGNLPSVRLLPGEHRLQGRFFWSRLPEMIPVPPSLGLIHLVMDGRAIAGPLVDEQGRLWLRKSTVEPAQQDAIKVQVFRLLDDTIPMRAVTVLRLVVSGKAREIDLPAVLLEGTAPMALESLLPARIQDDGRLTLQARPGRWEVRLIARLSGPQFKINAGDCPYGDEIWSFQPHHDLRLVEIVELPPVEPSQTEMPNEWRSFQAFLVQAQSALVIKELRRGDPDPAPDQLSLARIWWLDFDGRGLTTHDQIQGTLSRQWYLAMNRPGALGRVAVDGQDRVITEHGEEQKPGVELRQGQIQLQADARWPERSGALPAVGWDHDFQSVSATLNLPPGWRLLAAAGVDSVSGTWFQRWSLLDFFLVLIITLAVYRLRALKWAAMTLAAMVLIFHEPGAPRLIWLHLLAVLALLPLLPPGWFKRLVGLYGLGAAVALLIMAVPFVVQQIRWSIYPQLAPADSAYGDEYARKASYSGALQREEAASPLAAAPETEEPVADEETDQARMEQKPAIMAARDGQPSGARQAPALPQQEPDALIPTGPGLPDWQWQSIELGWSGPVAKEQTLRLYLLSPLVNLILGFLRAGLLAVLIWVLLDVRAWWQRLREKAGLTAAALLALLFWVAGQPTKSMAAADVFPPSALLDELRQRLLEKPDCLPQCADISRMEITAGPDQLEVSLKINCAQRVAVPLPVNRKSWTPGQIMLDNTPMGGLSRDAAGQLWGLVPAGLHTLILRGDVSQEALIQMPFPLRPRAATCSTQGWSVDGIDPDGLAGSSIQLSRLQTENSSATRQRANVGLPPFLKVERVLHLGLTWRTTTTVTRLSPTGAPVVISIPLLAAESVTTPGISVSQGHALINMAPDQRVLSYQAGLPIESPIALKAPRAVAWSETWIVDASPVWHCDFEGIAPVHHQNSAGQWRPQWQPWPDETVVVHVQRPAAVAAQTKTIDQAALVLTPGARFGQGELNLTVRAS